jgi:phage tail-like protein
VATTIRSDPLRNFKFQVQINYTTKDMATNQPVNLGTFGFMSVSGLSMSTEMIPYREGGMNTTTRKMPGQSDFPPVTFQRGLFVGPRSMYSWMKDIFVGTDIAGADKPDTTKDFRTTIVIRVLPHPGLRSPAHSVDTGGGSTDVSQQVGKGKAVFALLNAWPTSWSASDLDAGGNGIIMEQMTVVHEGLVYVPAPSGNSNASWVTGAYSFK